MYSNIAMWIFSLSKLSVFPWLQYVHLFCSKLQYYMKVIIIFSFDIHAMLLHCTKLVFLKEVDMAFCNCSWWQPGFYPDLSPHCTLFPYNLLFTSWKVRFQRTGNLYPKSAIIFLITHAQWHVCVETAEYTASLYLRTQHIKSHFMTGNNGYEWLYNTQISER